MQKYKKIGHWIIDYLHMFQGGIMMMVHKNPPKHYLNYALPGKAPVILLPRILGKWGFMKRLGDRISLAGHPVYIVPELQYNIYSIPASAKKLRAMVVHAVPKLGHILPHLPRGSQIVKNLIEKYHLTGAVLVAHSKGGLIGKYLLAHHNQDHRVKGLIAIATPFSGSRLAKLIPHHSFKELEADSHIIRDLESHHTINHQIISLMPRYDNHIWAEKGSFLKGAENIVVDVHGHHKVLFEKNVQEKILALVEKISSHF